MIRSFICSGSLIDCNYCDTSDSQPAGKEKIAQGAALSLHPSGFIATDLLRLEIFLTLTNEQWTYNSAQLEVKSTAEQSRAIREGRKNGEDLKFYFMTYPFQQV